jgi:aromatic-L-amino-acid decarboxylase
MSSYPLEPGRADMEAMGHQAITFLADFVDALPTAPASNTDNSTGTIAALRRPPTRDAGDLTDLLSLFARGVAGAVNTSGPGYLAFIPGGGVYTSALAELLARGVNRFTGLPGFAPGLTAMEDGVIRWLCDQFHFPARATGLITTGGSMANLSAVVTARHDRLGEDFLDGTIYVTAHTHHSIEKAARIAGVPAARVRTVPTNPDLRMDAAAAARMITEDRAAGRRPFLLVGTGGTTNTGAVDPLDELAALARRENLWFHVDAAYGGFFQLTKRGRERLAGIERADSITLDPHKGLFLPYGTGVLLVRDESPLRAAHSGDGYYLQDMAETDGWDLPHYANLGPELSREFRGLRLWLPLHLHGVGAFEDALNEKLDLAAHAYQQLAADPSLDVPWSPDLSVVVFRMRGDDRHNEALLQRINGSRRIFLSSTRIDGRYLLRLCVLSHRTHADRIDEALQIIRQAAQAGPA